MAISLKQSILKFLIFALCIAIFSPANATILKNLFEVGVPVMSQSGNDRKKASKEAFEILLVRITGRRDLASTETGQLMIENARRYVSSFRYEVLVEPVFDQPAVTRADQIDAELGINELINEQVEPEVNVEPVHQPEAIKKPTQKLVVRFDERAVTNSLWKQKLPVWGETRPGTLLWVAVQGDERRILLDSNESTPLLAYIQKQAEKRGLPMLFPLLDLEDQISINVTDVWGGFKDPIKNASLRYLPEAILSARLFRDTFGVWQTRWTLYQGTDELNWQVTAPDLETAVIDGLDQLADRLALKYAHISSVQDDSEFLIHVTEVKTLSDYERVNTYFAALSSIKRAELAQIKGDELVYRLDLRSNSDALKQAIKLGKVLLTSEDPFAIEASNNSRLSYRLLP